MRAMGLLLTTLLLIGCTSDDPVDEDAPAEQTDASGATPETSSVADDTADAGDDDDPQASSGDATTGSEGEPDGPPAVAQHGEPIAVLAGPLDGAVTAEVLQLQRTGTTLELSMVVRNAHEDDGWGAGYGHPDNLLSGGLDTDDPAFSSIAGVALVDGVNGKRHYPLRDPEGNCACSTGKLNVTAGDTLSLFASYPAPPEDVETMTLQVPLFGSIEVPIQ